MLHYQNNANVATDDRWKNRDDDKRIISWAINNKPMDFMVEWPIDRVWMLLAAHWPAHQPSTFKIKTTKPEIFGHAWHYQDKGNVCSGDQ